MESFGLAILYSITAFDDLRTRQVRVMELIVFAVLGLLIDLFSPTYSWLSILGGVSIGMVLMVVSYFSKEKIGMGDALIVAVSGLYLGFVNTLILLWLSSSLTSIYGVIKKKQELPFIPFLTVAYVIMLMIHQMGGLLL